MNNSNELVHSVQSLNRERNHRLHNNVPLVNSDDFYKKLHDVKTVVHRGRFEPNDNIVRTSQPENFFAWVNNSLDNHISSLNMGTRIVLGIIVIMLTFMVSGFFFSAF